MSKKKPAKKTKRTKDVKEVERSLGMLGFKDMPIPTNREEAIKYNKGVFNFFLKQAGATRVSIQYNGGGDEGHIEQVTVYKPMAKPKKDGESEEEVDVSKIEASIYSISTEYCPNTKGGWKTNIATKTDTLDKLLDEFAYELLEDQPFDWVNNEGGFGTLEYDVATNKFTMDHSQRIETVEHHGAEW